MIYDPGPTGIHIACFLGTIKETSIDAALETYPKSYQQHKPQATGTTESKAVCHLGAIMRL